MRRRDYAFFLSLVLGVILSVGAYALFVYLLSRFM